VGAPPGACIREAGLLVGNWLWKIYLLMGNARFERAAFGSGGRRRYPPAGFACFRAFTLHFHLEGRSNRPWLQKTIDAFIDSLSLAPPAQSAYHDPELLARCCDGQLL